MPEQMSLEERVSTLLNKIGSRAKCKGCGQQIWWVTTRHGKKMPVSESFLCHFEDCQSADQFRSKPRRDEEVNDDAHNAHDDDYVGDADVPF